ncbi:MAG: o-succinylbenzoate synthase [Planctomycetota bacterium]
MKARLHAYRLRFLRPLTTARGRVDARRGWLLELTDGARTGWGDAATWPGFGPAPRALRAALRELARRDPTDLASWTQGIEGPARHAAASAWLDLEAQRQRLSLARLLNPRAADRARTHTLVSDPEDARAARAAGASAFKLKVGGRPLDEDLARVHALRAAAGPEAALRLDANGAWNRAEAEVAWPELVELGVELVEQPLAADDLAGLRVLRGRGVAVGADESLALLGPDALARAEAADVWVLKPQALGGPDRALALGRRARDAGARPLVTHALDSAVGRRAALHVACALDEPTPHGLGDPFGHDVLPAQPLEATGPGLGLAGAPAPVRSPRTPVEVGS